jgi:hypothetical protein
MFLTVCIFRAKDEIDGKNEEVYENGKFVLLHLKFRVSLCHRQFITILIKYEKFKYI